MFRRSRSILVVIALVILAQVVMIGCRPPRLFHMTGRGSGEPVKFPNGTVLGGASSDQAAALAEILVESHNIQMRELGEIKEQNLQTAQQALTMLEEISQRQGSGEITLFFPTGSSTIPHNGMEYKRLVRFVDYVSRESSGRKVHFILIGSASATGSKTANERLSMRRAKVPIDIIDKYLVNVPHDFFEVNGVGDMYSPKKVSGKVHKRYQNVRVIATYADNPKSTTQN